MIDRSYLHLYLRKTDPGLNLNGNPIKDNKTNFNNKVPGLKNDSSC